MVTLRSQKRGASQDDESCEDMGNPGQVGHRHHYVARLLLRNFTHDKGKQRLFVFDKHTGKSYPGSVGDVGQEHGFNDIILPDGKIFPFEPVLSDVDADASDALRRLLDGRVLPSRESDDRRTLAEYAAVQHLRGPNCRKLYECLNQLTIDSLGADIELAEQAIQTADYTPAQAAFESAASMLTMVPKLMDSILSKVWMLVESSSATGHFCISDNPIAMNNDDRSEVMIGFDVDGIEISFPLSSTVTLFMICPSAAEKYSTANPNFKKAIDDGTPFLCNTEMVRISNEQQVAFAERFIYQSTDDFRYARDLLREFPELVVGPRFSLAVHPTQPQG